MTESEALKKAVELGYVREEALKALKTAQADLGWFVMAGSTPPVHMIEEAKEIDAAYQKADAEWWEASEVHFALMKA